MIVFNVNHTNYKLVLRDLATALNVPLAAEDLLVLEPPVGQGALKTLSLFDDLQVLLVDITFGCRLVTNRSQSPQPVYILHFDDLMIDEPARFVVDNESLQKTNTRHAVARLTSSIFENIEEIPAGLHLKSVKILFTEEWMRKYLGLQSNTAVLQQYLSLKTESFDMQKLDGEYFRLMDSLWSADPREPLQNLFLQNRVALLVERFFTHLFEKRELLRGGYNLSPGDIQRIMKVRENLVSDFSRTPPSIEEMGKLVAMGSTQLKRKFKHLFGESIYAYFQKQRMQKARELLVHEKYNVNQTASAVGYLNTTNFITAFKKHYKSSPGEMSRQ